MLAGVPFREAHRRTGELLKQLSEDKRTLRDMTSLEWEAFGVPDGAAYLDADRAVRARATSGGPSPESVSTQIELIERALAGRRR